MKPLLAGLVALLILLFTGCRTGMSGKASVTIEPWGFADGNQVYLFTMTNGKGMTLKVTNYGATITYISAPDRNGNIDPLVLGFDSLDQYLERHPNFGSTIGRYANRIGGARFSLEGQEYTLAPDRYGNSIHGGLKGFSRQVFDIDTVYASRDSAVVTLEYLSRDMEEGYPGNLLFSVTYVLTADNEIRLEYVATSDMATVVNFTNHSYFNLSGCVRPVLDHILTINADLVTPVDTTGIPTGELLPVKDTPYDFTVPVKINDKITSLPRGYDINYVLRKAGQEMTLAAELYDPSSGRLLQAFTTEPGMQLYSANSDLSRFTGHNGIRYDRHYGLCLEMQHFPDSPNKSQFPAVVLKPGEQFRQLTIYKFSVREQ
jgi:aldose 1-epimerase